MPEWAIALVSGVAGALIGGPVTVMSTQCVARRQQRRDARVDLLERTGRVVSAAALVMVVTFAGFVFGHVADLREFGVGLALGVLVDATILRPLLLPSLMSLLGRWNWWLSGDRLARHGGPCAIMPSSSLGGT